MAVMVTRIRKTLAVQQRSAAFERTNKIVADAPQMKSGISGRRASDFAN
jgi:hypothetical protein